MRRGGPLRRVTPLRALRALNGRRPAPGVRRAPTGPAFDVRSLVLARAGLRCELCGGPLDTPGLGHSLHHRIPRGMGGTSDPALNEPTNLLAVCGTGTTGCHGWVESERRAAYAAGWLVHRHDTPADIPAVIHGRGLTYLTPAGGYEPATGTENQ